MRRTALTIIATIVGLVLLLNFKTHSANSSPGGLVSLGTVPVNSQQGRHHRSAHHPIHRTVTPAASPTARATPSASRAPKRKPVATKPVATKPVATKPRTVTAVGQTAQTQYGPVQVRIVETAGRLTDVTAIQVPSDSAHSSEIAAYAVPILRSEALRANSARIDIVSGATYTSDGYAQSLQSALDNA